MRIVCPDCSGRQVTWHGRTLRDCSTCRGKGSLPLMELIRDGVVGFALFMLIIIGTIAAAS